MAKTDPLFQFSNYCEAGLWWIVAAAMAVAARRWSRPARADARIWVIVLLTFGASDLVEAHTGAWWRPWWLLVWKGGCLLLMLVMFARYLLRGRGRRSGSGAGDPS
jgi:hypothetical protein